MELVINDRIRNRKITFFESFDVNLKYDAFASTFSFSFMFDPDNIEHKEMTCIGHFHIVKLFHNGQLLLTGIILSTSLTDQPESESVTISGYSLPGVLEDCEIPTTSYPLQVNGMNLEEISSKLIQPFGITQVIDSSVAADMKLAYDDTDVKPGQSIGSFLSQLATQRNIIISHDQYGRLVYTRPSKSRQPIFHFESNIPQTSMALSFDGQRMHSSIKVFQQKEFDPEIAVTEAEVINPYVIKSVFRPHVAVQSSGDAKDTEKTAKNILANELRGLSITINTDRWIIDNKVITPGNLVTAQNPRIYLYKSAKLFMESVRLQGDKSKTTASIGCVLPEVYSGDTPEYLFKGINLH